MVIYDSFRLLRFNEYNDFIFSIGRAGAEKLLDILRKESMIRLYKEDAKIPREYKV